MNLRKFGIIYRNKQIDTQRQLIIKAAIDRAYYMGLEQTKMTTDEKRALGTKILTDLFKAQKDNQDIESIEYLGFKVIYN